MYIPSFNLTVILRSNGGAHPQSEGEVYRPLMPIKERLRAAFAAPSDWLAGTAGLLLCAAVTFYWFMPVGTSCTSIDAVHVSCQTVSLASSMGWGAVLLTPLVVASGVGLGAVYFRCRRVRILLLGFPLAAVAFFVLSFGMDGPFLPAALASLVSALLLKPRPYLRHP